MNQKFIPILVIIVVVLGAGYYFYNQNKAVAPAVEDQAGQESLPAETGGSPATSNESPANEQKPKEQPKGTFSSGEEPGDNVDIQVLEVVFDGTQFTPSSINIKVNDYVIFRNKSSVEFWPASAPHPTHTDYPEFDAKKAIAPGGKFQFQFQKAGAWKYHDHLNSSVYGVVNVSAR